VARVPIPRYLRNSSPPETRLKKNSLNLYSDSDGKIVKTTSGSSVFLGDDKRRDIIAFIEQYYKMFKILLGVSHNKQRWFKSRNKFEKFDGFDSCSNL
jgi:hypothetical protein